MVVYIGAGIVVLLVLVLAYRSLAGGSTADGDSAALLRVAEAAVSSGLDEMAVITERSLLPESRDPDLAHSVRRRSDGAAQLLERVEVTALEADGARAHALLMAAAHETSWAARLVESREFGGAPGMHAAATALVEHARRCCADAHALLGGSDATAKGGDSAAESLVE